MSRPSPASPWPSSYCRSASAASPTSRQPSSTAVTPLARYRGGRPPRPHAAAAPRAPRGLRACSQRSAVKRGGWPSDPPGARPRRWSRPFAAADGAEGSAAAHRAPEGRASPPASLLPPPPRASRRGRRRPGRPRLPTPPRPPSAPGPLPPRRDVRRGGSRHGGWGCASGGRQGRGGLSRLKETPSPSSPWRPLPLRPSLSPRSRSLRRGSRPAASARRSGWGEFSRPAASFRRLRGWPAAKAPMGPTALGAWLLLSFSQLISRASTVLGCAAGETLARFSLPSGSAEQQSLARTAAGLWPPQPRGLSFC